MADFKVKNRLVVTGSEAIVNGEQVSTTANTQTLTNKTISGASNTITNIPSSALSSGVDAAKIADGSVSNAEFQYLNGVTSDIQTQLDAKALDSAVIKKDGSVAFTAAQSMGGNKLTSLAAGTASSDAVNKGQLDAALEGLKPKAAVRVATTANITIATALNAGDVIDGITLVDGDRVLVKDQTAAEQNGIYVVSATPSRSTDFDSLSPIDEVNGSLVAVQQGTDNAGKVFVQSGVVAVLDTDPINFVMFNSASTLVGGNGITVSGTNVSVDHDGQGLQFTANQLALELDGTTLTKSATGLKVSDTTLAQYLKKDGTVAATGSLNMGGNSITNINQVSTSTVAATSVNATSVNADQFGAVVGNLNGGSNFTLPSGVQSNLNLMHNGSDARMAIYTANNAIADASSTSAINIETGNKTAGTGNSGSITIRTGTSVGGVRGSVSISAAAINVNSAKITNLADPTSTQDAATKAYVDATVSGSAYTNEQAQDAVGSILTDTSTIDFTYNDAANTIIADVVDGSITNVKVASGIDAVKLADGSVSNTELQYINTVTSNVQDQLNAKLSAVVGDIQPTSFSMTNNQSSPANVTGLAFANATTRSFKALIDIKISATADLYEAYEILGVQKGSTWDITQTAVGDDSGVVFSITTAGQIQYTSTNITGFTAGVIKFRANTIPVA